ncbi:alpha-Man-Ia, partial [Symbiodinium pilosum]
MGDSYYEYLLKQWIQGGKKDARLKDAWKRAMKEMMDTMVVTTSSGLQFVAELEGPRQRNRMDHLACFVAGMLMLGSRTLPRDEVDPRWEPFAAELTHTCYQMYVRMPTGLSPEYVAFNLQAARGQEMSVPGDAPHNLLRPEAAEALWYMWYYTGDPKYRQWGHEMFVPFLRHCKVKYGFSAITDVRKKPPPKRDSQESFWLGETLKYFYLLFSPRSTLNLEEFVLNTEAQPLRIL